MTLPIPPSPDGRAPDFPLILDSIFEFDQFDDWIADPLYLEDQRLDRDEVVRRIEAIWRSRRVDPDDRESVSAPRAGGGTLPVLALGLDLRAVTHAVIAGLAPRIRAGLLRDKVAGFDTDGKSKPLFQAPGQGLKDLARDVRMAAMILGDESIHVVDVVDFSNAARFETLEIELGRAGARPDQVNFLRAAAAHPSGALPPIDDAFSFLYNFYLAPVDRAIAAQRINFFRYRDEYLVIRAGDVAVIERALQAHGLTGRRVGAAIQIRDIKDALHARWYDQDEVEPDGRRATDSMSEIVANVGEGVLVANFTCDTLGERDDDRKPNCQTDSFELDFEDDPDRARDLFWSSCRSGSLHDAVHAVPVLRAFNRARLSGVLHPPPLDRAPEAARTHRAQLATHRVCLTDALAVAIDRRSAWQVSWTAPLLADLGPLTDAEIGLMRNGLAADLGPVAELPLRIALARASTEPAEAVWRDGMASAGWFRRRSSAVAAYFLARRGSPRAWLDLRDSLALDQPILARFLNGYL